MDALSESLSGIRVSFSGLNAVFCVCRFGGNDMNRTDAKADLPLNLRRCTSFFPTNPHKMHTNTSTRVTRS